MVLSWANLREGGLLLEILEIRRWTIVEIHLVPFFLNKKKVHFLTLVTLQGAGTTNVPPP